MSRLLLSTSATIVVGLTLIHSFALCEEPNPKKPAGTPGATDNKPVKVDFDLNMRRPVSVDFKDVPLSDAVDHLIKIGGIQMYFERKALEDLGVTTDATVTLRLQQVSLMSVLQHLLNPLELTWIRDEDTVLITSSDFAGMSLIIRGYNVADLVRVQADSEWGSPEDTYDHDTLAELITSTVYPQGWDDVGGPGSVQGFHGVFVISQTRWVHEEITGLLKALRSVRDLQKAPGPNEGQTEMAVPIAEPARPDLAEARIRKALQQVVELSFKDTPLDQAMEQIGKSSGVEVLVDRKALEDSGIDPQKPITFKGKGLTLEFCLRRILKELDLTWVIQDEVLLITTQDAGAARIVIKVYPVADLVKPFGRSDESANYDRLMEQIRLNVQPQSWGDNGGPGSMSSFPPSKALVIANSDDMHMEVETVLSELRKAVAEQPKATDAQGRAAKTDADLRLAVYRIKVPAWSGKQPGEQVVGEIMQFLVAPDSWAQRGAYLKAGPGFIVVRQTKQVHRRVSKLLHELGVVEGPAVTTMMDLWGSSGCFSGLHGDFFGPKESASDPAAAGSPGSEGKTGLTPTIQDSQEK